MFRWPLRILALLSLFCMITAIGLWVRSYETAMRTGYVTNHDEPGAAVRTWYQIYWRHGSAEIEIARYRTFKTTTAQQLQDGDFFSLHPGIMWYGYEAKGIVGPGYGVADPSWMNHTLGIWIVNEHASWPGGATGMSEDNWERGVDLPGWMVALFFALLPTFVIWRDIRRFRHRRRARIGRCAACGYDLRASPERCPECGTIPLTQAPRRTASNTIP